MGEPVAGAGSDSRSEQQQQQYKEFSHSVMEVMKVTACSDISGRVQVSVAPRQVNGRKVGVERVAFCCAALRCGASVLTSSISPLSFPSFTFTSYRRPRAPRVSSSSSLPHPTKGLCLVHPPCILRRTFRLDERASSQFPRSMSIPSPMQHNHSNQPLSIKI